MNKIDRIKSLIAQSKEFDRQAAANYRYASDRSANGLLVEAQEFNQKADQLSKDARLSREYALELGA